MMKEHALQFIEKSDTGLGVVDTIPEGTILYANDFFYNMIGYSKEEYENKHNNRLMEIIADDEIQGVKSLIYRQASMGGAINLEFHARRSDGSKFWMKVLFRKHSVDEKTVYFCTFVNIDYPKTLMEQAFKSKQELDIIANSIPGGLAKIRMTDMYLKYANDGFFRLAGYTRAEYSSLFQNHCNRLLHPDDLEITTRTVNTALDNKGLLALEYRIVAKDGSTRWSYLNGRLVDDEDGELVYLCIIIDVTNRKRAEKELKEAKKYAEGIAKMRGETFWSYHVPTKTLRRMGDIENSYINGREFKDPYEYWMQNVVHPADAEEFSKHYKKVTSSECYQSMVVRFRNKTGDYETVKVSAEGCKDEETGDNYVYGVIEPYTDELLRITQKGGTKRSKEENRLIRLAKSARAELKDSVSGLMPYSSFLKKVEKILNEPEEGANYAFVCADINNFHRFNQHYGFSRSNEILRKFGKLLKNYLSFDGLCSRVDGDYFVMFYKYDDHKSLIKAITRLFNEREEQAGEGDYVNFNTAIGLYLVKDYNVELITMLENADLARRSIKGIKGDHYSVYTDDIRNNTSAEDELIEDVRIAMRNKQLEIKYRPRIQGDKSNIIGCKALPYVMLRDGSYIDHNRLMRLLEKTSKLEDFGVYIFTEVANNLGAWKALGNKVIPVSIVFSAIQLSSERVVRKMDKVVEMNNLEPSDFIFEIPEKYFTDRTLGFEKAIKKLVSLGYSVVVSRFGSFNLNVSVVKALPITGIKLHGEYFNDYLSNERDKKILRKIIELCNDINISVMCGSINTELQYKFAKEIGCEIMEGDYIYAAAKNRAFEHLYLGK
ncbi:MAG: EAL domain-containing protein [Lachnospiraceae bacterium]|nr:EAL domain-containing protein [Lachnospiraceae bacterium]